MEIKVTALVDDKYILNNARRTVWKDGLEKEPSEKFMDSIYFKEHSPIRTKTFLVEIKGVKYWTAMHFVRHKIGFEPFVSTQRDDRITYTTTRDERGQGELVDMNMVIDAQAFINISRKRKCNMAHAETRKVWNSILEELKKVDPYLERCCVRECVYRNGICPECDCTCGFNMTEEFNKELKKYMEGRNEYCSRR